MSQEESIKERNFRKWNCLLPVLACCFMDSLIVKSIRPRDIMRTLPHDRENPLTDKNMHYEHKLATPLFVVLKFEYTLDKVQCANIEWFLCLVCRILTPSGI